jgi:glycosyltransferase involved in cell wall biosynthesis
MKKILVYGMTDNLGGIESYIMALFRNMDKNEIRFDFVTDFPSMVFDKEVREAGSLIHFIPSKSSDPVGHLLKFRKILKDHPEYETVYFNILNAGAAITITVAKLMKRTVVVHSHNGLDDNMRLHKVFRPLLIKCADTKLACSEIAGKYMFGDGKEVTVINNAVKVEKFLYSPQKRQEKRNELGISETEFAVLHAGRMTIQKNPLFLLRIFAEIVKKEPNALLLYAGAGEMEGEIKALAEELHLSPRIRFLGMRSDVDLLYQAADAFLLPSNYEGLPIVLIEAQTAGLPSYTSAAVTKEAKITDLLTHISLEKSAEEWADIIVRTGKVQRKNMRLEIERAGFSIDIEIAKTQNILTQNS